MQKISVLEKIINAVPVILAFLMPLFYLTTTTEFFEFNKQLLLIVGAVILLIAWAIRILLGKEIEITRSVLDFPILALLAVILVSTVFSIDKTSSIYGSNGRWFPSLLGYAIFALFYYLVSSGVNNLKVIRKVLEALTISSTISTVIALFGYYQIHLGSSSYLKIANFTVTGSVTTAIVLATIACVISLSLLAYETSALRKFLFTVAIIINFIYMSLVGIFVGWFVLSVGIIALVIIIKPATIIKNQGQYMFIVGLMLAIVLVTNIAPSKNILQSRIYPKEINLPIKESWLISTAVVRDYPLLATGPSTFYINFSKYRPVYMNNSNLWNIRFDKPFNELFNIFAETGILGLIALAYLATQMYKLIRVSYKTKEENGLIKILGVIAVTSISVLLVTYATTLNMFVVVLLTALLVRSLHVDKDYSKISRIMVLGNIKIRSTGILGEVNSKSYTKYVIAIPCFAVAMYVGYVVARNYAGEYFTRESVYAAERNEWNKVYSMQENALKSNPMRDTYYTRHAQTSLALANNIASKPTLDDKDKNLIQVLVANAIKTSKIVTEGVNPLNVKNWETRAAIYTNLSQVAKNASDWAIASYNIAIQLDPTNPKLRLDLGGIYYAKADYLAAGNQFRQAIALKPDYANAYYNFAQALIRLGDYENARTALERTKALLPEGSEDFTKVQTEIVTLNSNPNVAGAETQKPTVEDLEQKAPTTPADKTATTKEQEPLSTVGEETKTVESTQSAQPIQPVQPAQ